MASADRKATRRVPIVVWRRPSVAAATSRRPWAWRPEGPQGGQSLDQFEEAGRQRRQPPPLPAGLARPAPRAEVGPWPRAPGPPAPARMSAETQSVQPTQAKMAIGASPASTAWGR